MFRTSTRGSALGLACLALVWGPKTQAAENITADVGVSYNTHFVSYGLDVWGGGNEFYGDRATTFFYGDLAIKWTDSLTFTLNVWSDINNNTASGIGGHLQEVDFNPGFTYTFGKVAANVTYAAWTYAGDVEESVDFTLSFDDSGLFPGFSLAPKVVWHDRVSGNGAQTVGSAIVLSVGPGFMLSDGLSLTIPAGVAFFTTDDFQGGTKSGYGYSYIGGSLGYGLDFIPESMGNWSINFDVIAYFTDKDAIPGNPSQNFLFGSVGLKVAY